MGAVSGWILEGKCLGFEVLGNPRALTSLAGKNPQSVFWRQQAGV